MERRGHLRRVMHVVVIKWSIWCARGRAAPLL